MKILVIGALPESLVNFRGPLIKAMIDGGHRVVASAYGRSAEIEAVLAAWGVDYESNFIQRASTNPLGDFRAWVEFIRIIRRVKPDVVLDSFSLEIEKLIVDSLIERFALLVKHHEEAVAQGRAYVKKASG